MPISSCGYEPVSRHDVDFGEDVNIRDLTGLRVVRCLRLFKLVRLFRGSRIFVRWETRISINYASLDVVSVVVLILASCHWLACLWGLQASFAPLHSWPAGKGYCVEWGHTDLAVAVQMLTDGSCPHEYVCSVGACTALDNGVCTDGHACVGPWAMYAYSLYFAVRRPPVAPYTAPLVHWPLRRVRHLHGHACLRSCHCGIPLTRRLCLWRVCVWRYV